MADAVRQGRLPARLPARPLTATRRQELAARLLDAADAQIAAGGLPSLRARALADAAGCALGAIYGVFPDLDELVLLVNRRTLDGIAAALAAAPPGPPAERLVGLADAYLAYASANRPRWDALFLHRMASGRPAPDWFVARRLDAFAPLAAPLAELCPGRTEAERAELARSLFAAVHGVVSLGLDEMLGATPLARLRSQLRLLVTAMAEGLGPG